MRKNIVSRSTRILLAYTFAQNDFELEAYPPPGASAHGSQSHPSGLLPCDALEPPRLDLEAQRLNDAWVLPSSRTREIPTLVVLTPIVGARTRTPRG